ncbi:MAG TPA: hypothetical protein DF383_11725, partial [Deltaproteobacteria bacterium]|nr:hypothetical protein [Deltaproteobacteria bacterium]
MNSDGSNLQHLTDMTSNNLFVVSPQWSPDGNRLLFISNKNLDDPSPGALPNSKSNLWVLDVATGSATPLTRLVDPNGYVDYFDFSDWSPDGSQVVYTSYRNPTNFADDAAVTSTQPPNIWVVDADGSGHTFPVTKLEDNGVSQLGSFNPQWSPDGSKIVYSSFRSLSNFDPKTTDRNFLNIWVTNADGSGGD